MTATAALNVVARATPLQGHVDIVSRDRITGWALGEHMDAPAALQILDNGISIARILANTYRPDLEQAGLGNGRHGFHVIIPGGLSPLTRHVIQIRREADGTELTGSPRVIEAADSFGEPLKAAVAQAVAAVADTGERESLLAFLAAQTQSLLQQQADSDSGRDARMMHRHWARQTAGRAPSPNRRALVIDEQWPVEGRDAGSQAVLSHIRALRSLGYDVSLIAADALDGPAPSSAPPGVTLCAAPFTASVEDVLCRQAECFDVVYLHRASIAGRYLALARWHQPRARILYSVADLHHLRMERQAKIESRPELLAASRAMRLTECTAAWSADAVLTHSAEEAELLRRAVPEAKVHRVLWSIAARPASASFSARRGLAFIGSYGHAPNLDAARFLVESIMPLVWRIDPTIDCLLVGSGMPESLRRLASDRIRIIGHVADLGAAVLDRVRLTVAPLRFGAGVKGKVLESFAAGVPCVMTPIAAEGFALPPNLKSLIGDDEAGLAGRILQLHGNDAPHAAASAAAQAFMQSHCTEAAIAAALQAAIP